MTAGKSQSGGYQRPSTISDAFQNPRYFGRIVIETPEGIYSTQNEERAVKYIQKMKQKYPDSPPVSTIISKVDTTA